MISALLVALPAIAVAQTDESADDRQATTRDLEQPALLTAMEVEQTADADQLVLTFDDAVPGYDAGYVDRVAHAGSSETGEVEPVDLLGDVAVELVLSPATATTDGEGLALRSEQLTLSPRLPALREAAYAGQFDGAVTVAIGVSGRDGFEVRIDEAASQLIVELTHPSVAATDAADGDAAALGTGGRATAAAVEATATEQFDDDDGSVHEDNINLIAAEGVTEGCATDQFCPTEPVTRAQMASFLARALDLPAADRDYFAGDDGSVHEDNINRIAAAGITRGCGPDSYCPAANVDRDQMASFLDRGFDLAAAELDYFIDDEGNTHEASINAAASAGVTAGCNTWSSRFCPGQDVTRGQMASFLARAMGLTDGVRLLLEAGDEGGDVEQIQRRLANLDYYVGPIDGIYGNLTEQAVTAFQKLHGLSRDAVVGPSVRERLANPRPFYPRSSSGTWMEVDETRQIMARVVNGEVQEIFNTSTGTEEPYYYNGQRYIGDTPNGTHEIFRQIDGWRTSNLGRLYRPKYFTTGGHAIHGYTSVPPYPASHGCVRVSIPAMDYLWAGNRLPIGAGVWVYNPYTP
jgi:hypothetical protein